MDGIKYSGVRKKPCMKTIHGKKYFVYLSTYQVVIQNQFHNS